MKIKIGKLELGQLVKYKAKKVRVGQKWRNFKKVRGLA